MLLLLYIRFLRPLGMEKKIGFLCVTTRLFFPSSSQEKTKLELKEEREREKNVLALKSSKIALFLYVLVENRENKKHDQVE